MKSIKNKHASQKTIYFTITFDSTNNNAKNKIVLAVHRDVVAGVKKMEQINYSL
jgi:hypothetical protein